MGILDWLLTDPAQADGGFLAALLHGGKPGGASAGTPTTPPPYAPPASLLGESPLINMLRGGFAGMNAANGYSGFGPQFAAGTVGGANAMAQRRQRSMQGQLYARNLKQELGNSQDGLAQIESDADYEALPSGTHFIGPDGHERVKP